MGGSKKKKIGKEKQGGAFNKVQQDIGKFSSFNLDCFLKDNCTQYNRRNQQIVNCILINFPLCFLWMSAG